MKLKLAIIIAILFWSSAFVGIRESLHSFSPEGLALSRSLIASTLLGVIYFTRDHALKVTLKDGLAMLAIGALGIGIYGITLNYGEMSVPSGEASFIISQSPILTAIIAALFLSERLTVLRCIGFLVSVSGIALMTMNDAGQFVFNLGLVFVFISCFAGALFSVFQKKYLRKYNIIQATTFVVWGGALSLLMFLPHLTRDVQSATFIDKATVIYMGIFPAALSYIAWSYVLANLDISRACTYLYFMPFVATLLGWLFLDEVPLVYSLIGGALAMLGVFIVDKSYRLKPSSF